MPMAEKKNDTKRRRAPKDERPVRLIVERCYIGTEKMETVFRRIVEDELREKAMQIMTA